MARKACKVESEKGGKKTLKRWAREARFACGRCGRRAAKAKHLCRPENID